MVVMHTYPCNKEMVLYQGKLTTEVKLNLPDIKTGESYTGWVVAENDWGTSLPSYNFSVVVLRKIL